MRDPTLRAGDVIMTDEGVRVFAGRAACPHTVGDFRTLAEARALPRAERITLAAMEQASKARPAATIAAEPPTVPSGPPVVASDPPIVVTDPPFRGKQR